MKTIYGLLVLSALMFVSGVSFVVLAARGAAAPVVAVPAAAPVATVKQLMNGIVTPSSSAIYGSVATLVDKDGVHETRPESDDDWTLLGSHAATLVEAGHLLMVPGRAQDTGDWTTISQAMVDAAKQCQVAADKQDTEAILACGEVLNNSCDNCHRKYQVDVR